MTTERRHRRRTRTIYAGDASGHRLFGIHGMAGWTEEGRIVADVN